MNYYICTNLNCDDRKNNKTTTDSHKCPTCGSPVTLTKPKEQESERGY